MSRSERVLTTLDISGANTDPRAKVSSLENSNTEVLLDLAYNLDGIVERQMRVL